MLYGLLPLVPLLLAAHAAKSFPADNRMLQNPGILRYPITVTSGAHLKTFNKRVDVTNLTGRALGNFYSIDIDVGTPGQTVSVNFDTGSSILWVNPMCSKSNDPGLCQTLGHFNSNASSTFNDTGTPGSQTYGSGYVTFEYATDVISIGSAKLQHQIFGVANDSEASQSGIMGAGPWTTGWQSPYPLVIDNLVQQGFINSRAYSLDLRSIDSPQGSVVFGGIDTKKFSGHLEKRAIIPAANSPDGATRFWIYLDGLSVNMENGERVTAFDKPNYQPVLLDSGTSLSSLPNATFTTILKAFPSAVQRGPAIWSVDCPAANSNVTVNFKFGKLAIHVKLTDFVLEIDGKCALGIVPSDEMPVLGDSFLRAAYVVYDWDNRNIHLAAGDDCGSNLVPIGRGRDSVPPVVGCWGKSGKN